MHQVTQKEFARVYQWLYAAIVEEAKRCLAARNASLTDPMEWPAHQTWKELGATSRSTFLREARENLNIPHEEFLLYIREGVVDVEDIYETGADALKELP